MAVQKHDAEDYQDIQERAFGYGEGNSKGWRTKAAKMCLIKFGLLNDDQYCDEDILEVDFDALNNSDENKESNILDTSESKSMKINQVKINYPICCRIVFRI